MDKRDATKPPFNRRRDDPWHEEIKLYVDQRHQENTGRFDHIEGRVLALEKQGAEMKTALDANTTLTESVKKDTGSLVEAWNGANTVGRFLLWLSPVATAGLAAFTFWWKK